MVYLPDGVSQFDIRGWQGRGRTYSANGLVFLRALRWWRNIGWILVSNLPPSMKEPT
jgi:hypothetical protein